MSDSRIVLPESEKFNFDDSSNCQDLNVNNEPTTVPMRSQSQLVSQSVVFYFPPTC